MPAPSPPLPCDRCPDAVATDACGPGPGHCLACVAMPSVGCGTTVREPGTAQRLGELATLEPDCGALAVPPVDVSMEDDPGGPLTAEEIGDPDQPPPGGWPMLRCETCEDGWRAKVAALEAEVARLRAVGGPAGPGAGG